MPKEQIKRDFKDGSGHFVLMVKREGNASGTGLLNGAQILEYGRHDIVLGVAGDPSGYLVATKGALSTSRRHDPDDLLRPFLKIMFLGLAHHGRTNLISDFPVASPFS